MIDVLINVVLGYLLADFIMGVYHWIKDTYFSPYTPLIGKTLVWGSRLHHIRPRFVCEFDDTDLFYSSAKWTLIWMGPLFLAFGLTPFLLSLFIVISLNDVIHKYAHMYDNERPAFVTTLQKLYILQTYEEHHQHHMLPHDVNYCPITPYLNVVLEKVNFWRRLEQFIENKTGIKPREFTDEFVEEPGYPAGVKFLEKN